MSSPNLTSWVKAVAIGVTLCAASVAEAGPIRTAKLQQLKAQRAQVRAYWNNYYAEALKNHSMKVKGLNALKVLRVNPDGTLPQTPMVAYLQWRLSLAPARFARFHPQLAQMLVRDVTVRGNPPTTPTNPVPGGVNPPPPPQVPEPGSLLVAATLAAAAFGGRRIARRTVGVARSNAG